MPSLAPFISREDLADLLNAASLTTSDAALIAVDSACDICRTEAGQTFNEVSNDTVALDGTGTDALLLPERPVTNVDSVAVDGDMVSDYVLSAHGILFRKSSNGTFTSLCWPLGRQNIEVSYDHGYADALFPRDVRVVALDIAARIFRQPTSAGIQSESLGAYSVSYVTNAAAQQGIVTPYESAILRHYKQARSF